MLLDRRAAEGIPQFRPQGRMDELQQVQRGRPAGGREKAPHRPREMQHVVALVDDDKGGVVPLHRMLGPAGQIARGGGLDHGRAVTRAAGDPGPVHRGEGEVGEDARCRIQPPEDARARLDGHEQVLVARGVLGITQEQEAAGAQGKVEQRDHLFLQFRVQVDQQVPAGNEVEPREGRVLDQAVLGEDAHLAQFLDHAIGVAFLDEPSCQPLGRHLPGDAVGISAGPPRRQRLPVQVRSEDLDRGWLFHLGAMFGQQDRQGIGLLAGRATDDPDPQRLAPVLALEQVRDHVLFEDGPFLSVAEEFGHADQKIVEQVLRLVGGGAEQFDIGGQLVDQQRLHPALDAAQEGAALVAVEVVAGLLAQQPGDRVQRLDRAGGLDVLAGRCLGPAEAPRSLFDQRHEAVRDLVHGKDGIGQCGRGVAVGKVLRHAFGQHQPARGLQLARAQGALAIRAVQRDADRPVALIAGQRHQEAVDDALRCRGLVGGLGREAATFDGHDHVGRIDVKPAGLDRHPVGDQDGIVPALGGGLTETALVEGFHVLQDEDKGGLGLGRQPPQQFLERGGFCCRGRDRRDDLRRLAPVGNRILGHLYPAFRIRHRETCPFLAGRP